VISLLALYIWLFPSHIFKFPILLYFLPNFPSFLFCLLLSVRIHFLPLFFHLFPSSTASVV
jgi:hypothetical protein